MTNCTKPGVIKIWKGGKEITVKVITDSRPVGSVPFLKNLKDTLKKEENCDKNDYNLTECLGHKKNPYVEIKLTTLHPHEFKWFMNCIIHTIQTSSCSHLWGRDTNKAPCKALSCEIEVFGCNKKDHVKIKQVNKIKSLLIGKISSQKVKVHYDYDAKGTMNRYMTWDCDGGKRVSQYNHSNYNITGTSQKVTFLYALSAKHGKWDAGNGTLKFDMNGLDVNMFSDRPFRYATTYIGSEARELINKLFNEDNTANSFAKNPPNAVLNTVDGQAAFKVLSATVSQKGVVSMELRGIANMKLKSNDQKGRVSLFIDNVSFGGSVSAGGVSVGAGFSF